MDSCNSGDVDLVSSSAEEDYEDSSFASSTPTQSPLPSLPPGLFHSSFDSLSPYRQLDSFVSSPHLDSVWSRKRPASSLLSPSPPVLGGATIPYSGDSGAVFPGSVDGLQPAPAATKSGKKRSRASRRAPTTVLTTDTTNFRQMVQEFTGIPTPPFGSTSPFSRDPRLDLLGGSGAVPPSFFVRSNFQQKYSPILSHLANNINTNNNGNNISSLDISPTNNTTNSFGPVAESPAPELWFRSGYQAQSTFPSSLFNVQSLMNSSSKFQFPSFVPRKPPVPDLPSLPDSIPLMNASARILNELGNNPCHVGLNRQDNVGAPINTTINISGTSTPSVHTARSLLAEGIGVMVDNDQVGIRPQPSTTGGNRSNPQQSCGGTICEMNYDTPPTKCHVEGSEAVSRAENTVESWICSSDLPTTQIPGTQLRPRT